jgi:cardiolipin synthase (CMP-forming)
LYYFHSHPDLPVSRVGKIRTGLLLVGTPLLVLSKLAIPASEIYAVVAWLFLGLGLVGHWIAGYNYFRAIIRKGKRLRAGSAGSAGSADASDDGGLL